MVCKYRAKIDDLEIECKNLSGFCAFLYTLYARLSFFFFFWHTDFLPSVLVKIWILEDIYIHFVTFKPLWIDNLHFSGSVYVRIPTSTLVTSLIIAVYTVTKKFCLDKDWNMTRFSLSHWEFSLLIIFFILNN